MHQHLLLSVTLFLATTTAQILTTGKPAVPACGQTCAQGQSVLQQAVDACGGRATSNQQIWSCFCQSAYLKTLYTSPNGICDAFCSDASQKQQLMAWYTGNCGSDFGASEHPEQAAVASSAAGAAPTTQTTAATATTTSGKPKSTGLTLSNGNGIGDHAPADGTYQPPGGWWANHWKWIIMLLVLIIGIGLFIWLMIWLKRRHDRRQDAAPSGFNEGITMRSTPMIATSQPVAMQPNSGRDSPVRTRDAFMPYGYGYSRSESRLGSRTNLADSSLSKGSPLVTTTTAADMEKDTGTPVGKKKRIYVREKSMNEFEDLEKR